MQKIQSHFSTYANEDLSRPPTWDKPVYTLSPEDQQFFNLSSAGPTPGVVEVIDVTGSTTSKPQLVTEEVLEDDENVGNATTEVDKVTDGFEYEELEETTDKFFEIITETVEVEKNSSSDNKTFIYITPKPPTYKPSSDADKLVQTTERVIDSELELNISITVTRNPVDIKLFNMFSVKTVRPEKSSTVTESGQ